MLRELLVTRRVLALVAVGTAIAVTGAVLWPLQGSGHGRQTPATAIATRGDVVVTVGGVGRIVEARGSAPLVLPSTAASSGPTTAPAGAVFPSVPGRLARFLVAPGQHVSAREPLAVLDDGGAAAIAVGQARSDLAGARLELRQKQTSDPAKGLPPTHAELRAARAALRAANERARVVAHPTRADIDAARADVRKAEADLATLTRPPGPAALTAAQAAVDVAARRLGQAGGPAPSIDLATATVDLARAQAELDALQAAPPPPSATTLQAAQLAVTLARQRLSELPPDAPPSDATAARLEVARAQADLEALQRPAAAPAPSALAAAQAAVDLATRKLAQLEGPPNPVTVASARLDLQKAQSDLETLRRPPTPQALAAGRLAVRLARERLAQLLHPTAAARDAARADAAKAVADLQTLRQRGAPASRIDVAIARLKVRAATDHLALARLQAGRLTVRAPFAGVVTSLLAAPGSPADPSTPVATIAALGQLAASVDLSEFDVARVHRGDAAVVAVDALGGRKLPGKVSFVEPTGIESGGVVSFPVRIALRGPVAAKPGMNVSVRIVVAVHRGVVRVPLEALSGRSVTVVDRAGRTQRRRVSLGLADTRQVEIRSGLRLGERVVLPQPGA